MDNEYAEYRSYIDEFAKTIDPDDQLPLRVAGYCLKDYEIHGECLDWLNNYLGKACPITLRMYLIPKAMKVIMEKTKSAPEECGFDENRMVFQPLKLVRVVVGVVNSFILDLQDNSKLYEVPLPPTSPNATELTKLKAPLKYSTDAIKNTRRTMEDRMMVIDDFNGYFNTTDSEPTFFYGIFDGHSGSDAATYSNSHLNYNIAVHPKYPSDIANAMREAFLVTDLSFLKKAKTENLNSGTTALCAILRKTEKKLYIGWCGDSQALIARLGNVRQIVTKHSPEDAKERKRIEDLGGVVLFWGNSYRVGGTLAVSRAIGDMEHKPFVSAEPDIETIDLDGEEDFIVLACDGLWDALSEDDVAITVYKMLKEDSQSHNKIASRLCALARESGSRDNISVIVVYLKEPHLIATQTWPSLIRESNENMENLNVYDDPAMENPVQVTMDALGNTNQDFYNNIFDASKELISDVVTIGKPTEITDMVMQQQPENEFVNFSDTLNSINNNKFNNGHDENIFMSQDQFESAMPAIQIDDQNGHTSNDTNNNSNDNFGPETNVDAIEEDFQLNPHAAIEGDKEKFQVELKETEDLHDFVTETSATLESKFFEEMSEKVPDLMNAAANPFVDDITNLMDSVPNTFDGGNDEFFDNKTFEESTQQHQQIDEMDKAFGFDTVTNFTEEIVQKTSEFITETASAVVDDMMSANDHHNEEEINMQEQMPEHDPEIISESVQQNIVAESEGEDSAEEEWNYVNKKAEVPSFDGLKAVEETQEKVEENLLNESESHQNFGQIESSSFEEISYQQEQSSEIEKPIEQVENAVQLESTQHQELTVDTEDLDEMAMQLNPEAKEFVPVSPTRTGPVNNLLNAFIDPVVAQSPCKGDNLYLEDNLLIPTESDFDNEANVRPHEVAVENSTEFINIKESMSKDDKLDQEYKDETQNFQDEMQQQNSQEYVELEKSFNEYSNGFSNTIDDAMNRSFYEGRDTDLLHEASQKDILNKCQEIPTFEDEQAEAEQMENGKPESDIVNHEIAIHEMIESSDNFEPEKFVEEIKKANGEVDKYTDQELSPTIEISPAVDIPVEPVIIPEVVAPIEQAAAVIIPDPIVDVTPTPKPKVEKKTPTSAVAAKKTTPLKSTTAPAASSAKKASPAVKTATTKAAPAPLKTTTAAPIKKPTTSSLIGSAKPASIPAARPKTTTGPSATSSTSTLKKTEKPAVPKTSTLVKKTTSVTSTSSAPPKPAARPSTAQVKPKLPSATERKPISSSAPTTRAPLTRPSTTAAPAAKPRVPIASRATSTTSTTTTTVRKTTTTSRLGADKPDSTTKTTTTVTRSPRPATTVSKTSTLKSPSSAGSMGVAATKKPLIEKKTGPMTSKTSTTTVRKTSTSPMKTSSSTVKKTTTVVQQKKVVNGDVVVQETTTVSVNGDNKLIEALENLEMNGHSNGITENGSGESQSMVIDTAAD